MPDFAPCALLYSTLCILYVSFDTVVFLVLRNFCLAKIIDRVGLIC